MNETPEQMKRMRGFLDAYAEARHEGWADRVADLEIEYLELLAAAEEMEARALLAEENAARFRQRGMADFKRADAAEARVGRGAQDPQSRCRIMVPDLRPGYDWFS